MQFLVCNSSEIVVLSDAPDITDYNSMDIILHAVRLYIVRDFVQIVLYRMALFTIQFQKMLRRLWISGTFRSLLFSPTGTVFLKSPCRIFDRYSDIPFRQ